MLKKNKDSQEGLDIKLRDIESNGGKNIPAEGEARNMDDDAMEQRFREVMTRLEQLEMMTEFGIKEENGERIRKHKKTARGSSRNLEERGRLRWVAGWSAPAATAS